MIDKNDVEKTLDTARHALSNRSELAWIGKSSLSVRAYFTGIFIGLSGIAEEDLLGAPFYRVFKDAASLSVEGVGETLTGCMRYSANLL